MKGERMPNDLMTVAEVEAMIGKSRATVFNLIRDHNLPRYRVPAKGKATLVSRRDIERAWNRPERQRNTAPGPKPRKEQQG